MLRTNDGVEFVVHGEPASKANSRRFVQIKGKPRFIKANKALNYEQAFRFQCPMLDPPITDDVRVDIKIFYATRRPDLDESLILDGMQDRIYKNDRQVKEKHIFWGLDKENPRAEIKVTQL